jgi:hypothetical protein
MLFDALFSCWDELLEKSPVRAKKATQKSPSKRCDRSREEFNNLGVD